MAWIKKKEAAARLGVSLTTMDRLVESGKLPAYRPGGCHMVFKEEDVAAYLEKCRVPVTLIPAQRRRKAVAPPPVCRYKPGDVIV